MTKTLVVIPARYGSSRFPGKVLVDIMGKSMIERVYSQISLAKGVDKIVIATDHPGVFQHVQDFCKDAMMTSEHHQSGTDRCAEVAAAYPDFEIIVNVQGDNPLISPLCVENLIDFHQSEQNRQISTLVNQKEKGKMIKNPHVVKVVKNIHNDALYFSRASIPYNQKNINTTYFTHIGVYCFKRDVLLALSALQPSLLEQTESLEQLRWLESGFRISCLETNEEIISVDVPEDIKLVKNFLGA